MLYAKLFAAETFGTMILMLGGPGTAILATGGFFGDGSVGVLGVCFGFGFALLVAVYAVGPISGCHVNPAVTVGALIARKLEPAKAPVYIAGQIVGAAIGGLLIWLIASTIDGFEANPSNFAVNGWDALSPGGFGFTAMVIVEIVMTAVLVFVVLSTTNEKFHSTQVGLSVGITLMVIHLISIPIDNTSVNPVRSFGVAIFAGGEALSQLWAFIVFPLVGAAVGVLAFWAMDDSKLDEIVEIDVEVPTAEGGTAHIQAVATVPPQTPAPHESDAPRP